MIAAAGDFLLHLSGMAEKSFQGISAKNLMYQIGDFIRSGNPVGFVLHFLGAVAVQTADERQIVVIRGNAIHRGIAHHHSALFRLYAVEQRAQAFRFGLHLRLERLLVRFVLPTL